MSPTRQRFAPMLIIAATIILTAPLLLAQNPFAPLAANAAIPNVKLAPIVPPRHPLPAQAGKHRDLKQKWESLTPDQRKQIVDLFKKYVGPQVSKAWAEHGGDRPGATHLSPDQVDKDKAPKVKASASTVSGRAPLAVTFTADGRDPDGVIASYQWSFADPSKHSAAGLASGPVVTHTFEQSGRYLVSVLATDNGGRAAVDHVIIRVDGANGEPAPTAEGLPVASPPYKTGVRPRKISTNGYDDDGDGLPDDFERQIADNFTPAYALSYYEYPWTGMSQMADRSDTEIPIATYPTYYWQGITPTSYFRVTPLRVVNGMSFLRIDYLELWNEDDGLVLSNDCFDIMDILDFFGVFSPYFLTGLGGHFLDNERAAFRVVAPAAGDFGDQYNLDPNAYVVDWVYTAAHEGTVFDQSLEFPFLLYPGEHLGLFLTLSKHGTYPFYPDGMPLMPWWMIDGIYFGVFLACDYVDPWICDLLYFIADEVVFGCVTEKHAFQGFAFTPDYLRLNVGELWNELPGGHFIEVPEIRDKLTQPLF